MNKTYSFFIIALLSSTLLSFHAHCQSKDAGLRVVLIRHAEKPEEGYTLNCQGINRARELPNVLYSKIGLPHVIYVPSFTQSDTTKHARMYQTIVPFSSKYNLPIYNKYKVNDIDGVSRAILKQNGTVLVVWEHKGLVDIAKQLGVEEKLHWKDGDFDSIWIITFSKKGKARLTVDHEGLHPSTECH
jgi:hypothetical protein